MFTLVQVGDLLTLPAGTWEYPRKYESTLTLRVSHVTVPKVADFEWVSLVGAVITDQLATDGLTRNVLVRRDWLEKNPPMRPRFCDG
ncbi:hypothetical protein GCM10027605_67140 [Micromonospora zhanjiangensis]